MKSRGEALATITIRAQPRPHTLYSPLVYEALVYTPSPFWILHFKMTFINGSMSRGDQ